MYFKGRLFTATALDCIARFGAFQSFSSSFTKLNGVGKEVFSKRYISLTNVRFEKEDTLEIGGVSKLLHKSLNPELVPTKYGI